MATEHYTTVEAIRAELLRQGYDPDAVCDAAAVHFQSAEIRRRTTPLTDEELDMLAEDDDRLFGGTNGNGSGNGNGN